MVRVLAIAGCLVGGLAGGPGPPGAPGAGAFAEADAFAEAIAVQKGDHERARACAARLLALLAEYGDDHPRAPDALAYAAHCHEVAGDFGAAVRVRELLVERYPQAPVARPALLVLADRYRTIAWFERAAAVMETYARRYPDDRQAPEFVHDAALLRAGLGQEAAAKVLLARAEEQLGKRDPARAAALFWARLDLLPGTYPDDQARRAHAEEYVRRHGSRGGLGRRILAEVAIAGADWRRSCKQKDTPLDLCLSFKPAGPAKNSAPGCADSTARTVVVHARDRRLAEAAQARFQAVLRLGSAWQREGDDEALRARIVEALDLAAIAVADRDLAADLELRMPTGLAFTVEEWRRDTGKKRDADIYAAQARKRAESQRRFMAFLEQRTSRGLALTRSYERVVAEKRSARGVVAAAARVAVVQMSFVDEIRGAEVPRELQSKPLVERFCATLRDQAGEIERRAQDAFAYCLSRAEAYHYTDAAVAFCEGELERRWPREFPALRELFARGQSLPAEPESIPVQLEPPEDEDDPAGQGDM